MSTWLEHAQKAEWLAKRALTCEQNRDFQQARKLYKDASDYFTRAVSIMDSGDFQRRYSRLADLCDDKARSLANQQSQQLVLADNPKYGTAIIELNTRLPFMTNTQIKSIAEGCVTGKTNLEDRAHAIFDWLENNIIYGKEKRGRGGYRMAHEVLKTGEGVCGEEAYLYIVMARHAGIKANYMSIKTDCYGKKVDHACARLFTPREFSSDVAYHMFDVKKQSGKDHRGKVLTDEEAIDLFKQWRWK